ncbi:MAG: hypothetical protein HC927_08965 [Deltaproteobacteria bacterium]|nr:hypothetical protein [Deltaproteobacteria bacterium]
MGVPPIGEGTAATGKALAQVYTNIQTSLSNLPDFTDPGKVVGELLKSSGLQVIQQLAGSTNMIAQVFAQVLAAAVWASDVIVAHRAKELQKDVALPPLQTEDPATDSWVVNRIYEALRGPGLGEIMFPDGGLVLASNADYTSFFMPAYASRKPWNIQWRDGGVAAQQGDPVIHRSPAGELAFNFDAHDASRFGFMPGTDVMLRVLQASFRYYRTVRSGIRIDRYVIRCRGVDEPCFQPVASFDGSRDCRQCVSAESVWPTQGIGWAYGGAPLNATTPGENVGAFYPSANKLLGTILDMIARPGPLLYTIDVEAIHAEWKLSFENFWETMAREWKRHRGWGWRGLLSRLATLMIAFRDPSGEYILGGRLPAMPLSLIVSPRDASEFVLGFEHSIFKRVIEPFCNDLHQLQRFYLDSTEVAYVPPGAGALYSGGKIKTTKLGHEFGQARAALLGSTKRMLVDLRRVSDPVFRHQLEQAGVKPSIVNPALGKPVTDLLKPEREVRPPRRPKRLTTPTLTGLGVTRRPPRSDGMPGESSGTSGQPKLGTTAAAALVGLTALGLSAGAAWLLLRERDRDR